eukprot:gene7262-7475_t
MSVVIMARAVSGQITMALWGPGSDPYRSVPTQVGTNYMEWPGLREADQDPAAAEGGHASIASEQQYVFLSRKGDKPLLVGQYVVVIHADMGQPLVHVQVSTPSSMTQLVADEQEALKELVKSCCSKQALGGGSDLASGDAGSWCSSVGRAVTYDLRQWYSDICHVAPNVCDKDGHLRRLILPPYALRCPSFPQAVAKFSRLQHLEMSYSTTPGTIADVANITKLLPQLQQLHLRGVGLQGPFSCELVESSMKLKSLLLSDNDKLAGPLPPCWLASKSLQELQLAGLSSLSGPLPQLASTSSIPGRGLRQNLNPLSGVCGFGMLKYINFAGIIGDNEQGFTGALPISLGFCQDLLYLDLSGHALSGPLPPLPPNMQFLNLSSNLLSQTLPEFAQAAQLQYLDLSFNKFSGTLQDMTLLPYLDWLDLSDNALSGPLPPLPPAVRWVDLSNNRLSGKFELTVVTPSPGSGSEMQLVLLDLKNNKLTGPLPASLTSAPKLSFLDLSFNLISGTLEVFAMALSPRNQILQINLSHNELEGPIPPQMQVLAAVRPVMVTMKDGLTPVTRILDLSHNQLSGPFPSWLITNLPQLSDSCKCYIGVSLDADKFECPAELPPLNRRAQEVLHRFESLQCMSSAGPHRRQQIPLWQLAGVPSHAMVEPHMHRTGDQLDYVAAAAPGSLVAPATGNDGRRLSPGAVAAVVLVSVGVLCILAAAAALLVVKRREARHLSNKASGGLLQDYAANQSPLTIPLGEAPGFENLYVSSEHQSSSPTASSSGSQISRCSQLSAGDGVCEIALVLKRGTAGGPDRAGQVAGEGSAAKALSKDGVV